MNGEEMSKTMFGGLEAHGSPHIDNFVPSWTRIPKKDYQLFCDLISGIVTQQIEKKILPSKI